MKLFSAFVSALLAATPSLAFDREAARIKELLVAIYTPMKSEQSCDADSGVCTTKQVLDIARIPAYAKWLSERGVVVVMPAGTNGESVSLSKSERKALTEAWAAVGPAHGLKVYPHVGCESVEEAVELAQHASQLDGVSGILSMPPVYFKPDAAGLAQVLQRIGEGAPNKPFWYYHFPDKTGVLPGKAHEVVALLGDPKSGAYSSNFMGVKFTDYNLMDFGKIAMGMKYQLKDGSQWRYNMLFGRDEQMLAGYQFGADAAASSTVNYSPVSRAVVSTLFKNPAGGVFFPASKVPGENWAKAMKLQQKVLDMCLLFGNYGVENVQKNIMKMVGMDVGPSMLPNVDMPKKDYDDLEKKLRALGVLDGPHPVQVEEPVYV